MKALRIRGASALLAATILLSAEPAAAQPTVPLVSFFSPSRGDFFTTSHPLWTCKIHGCGGESGDYRIVGMQGHVFNPSLPQPAGAIPLWEWFSDVRGDNFLTANPAWDPASGTFRSEGGANYHFVRLAGYINPVGPSFDLRLTNFWSSAVADNAALTTAREIHHGAGEPILVRVPPGYGSYRVEGFLLPPPSEALARCIRRDRVSFRDRGAWQARGNYIDRWAKPAGFLNGDAIQITAPADVYRIDYWGHQMPVRGYHWGLATGSPFPAPGVPRHALLGRVTTGRVYVVGQGWFEANHWFQALGSTFADPGPCMLYDAAAVTPGDLQLGFNDDNLSDNGGWANVTVQQWF
jgi:hypothetical protein